MQKRTTTLQLNTAIKNKLLNVTKSELYNKSTHQTDAMSPETFQESLEFLCESIFKDIVGWHFEYDIKDKQYIIEAGRINGDSDFIVIAHLCACDGVNRKDIDNALSVIEDD